MSQRALLPQLSSPTQALLRGVAPLARRVVRAGLARLERRAPTLIEGGRLQWSGAPGGCVIRVGDPAFYGALLLRGSIGAAETYALGHWDCDDLTALARLAASDSGLRGLVPDEARWLRPARRWLHRTRRNTLRGSRRNVEAHYDLGNDFFALFLDPSLTYSCAIFEDPGRDLEEAQQAKYARICRKLDLRPEHAVLEIGGGWGGFAIHAASRHGCRVVTTTISRQQLALARERVAKAGLGGKVRVLEQDYRQLTGRFDRLVSIEMIEAVGADHLDTFFRVCGQRLRPGGRMLLQAILTPEASYPASLGSVDFIKRYIFPGGQLPSLGAIRASLGRVTDLRVGELEDLTPHYAATLRHWREAFARNRRRIGELGHPETFLRLWELYLSACEGGFLERAIRVAQISLARPGWRQGLAGRTAA